MSEEILNEEIEEIQETEEVQEEVKTYDFPEGTIFYQEIREEDGVKWLAGVVTRPETADKYGILENHVSIYDLVIKKGLFYLKGYEKLDQTVAEIIKQKGEEIDRQLEELLDKTVHDLRRYKNIETCIGYFNSTNEKWRKEAREANAWRDDLYKKAEEILEKVKAGEIDYNEVDLNYIVSRVQPLGWEPEDIFE